jgi:hypothetical protein
MALIYTPVQTAIGVRLRRNWDFAIKIVGMIALIGSGLFTLCKFRDDRRVDLEHRRISDEKDDRSRHQNKTSTSLNGRPISISKRLALPLRSPAQKTRML